MEDPRFIPTISKPAQVRALAVPARQEILDALETAGPCAVADLARMLGRAADGLYHHLRVLERVGLIRAVERRKVGRHVFSVYDVSVRPLVMGYEKPVRPADVARVVASLQRIALRDARRALAGGEGPLGGPDRVVWGARARGWLSAGELRRLNELLGEALALVRAARRPAGGGDGADGPRRCVSVQFVLTPSGTSRRRRSGTGRPPGDES